MGIITQSTTRVLYLANHREPYRCPLAHLGFTPTCFPSWQSIWLLISQILQIEGMFLRRCSRPQTLNMPCCQSGPSQWRSLTQGLNPDAVKATIHSIIISWYHLPLVGYMVKFWKSHFPGTNNIFPGTLEARAAFVIFPPWLGSA